MTHLEQRDENTFDGWWTPQWLLDLVRTMGPIAAKIGARLGYNKAAILYHLKKAKNE